MEINLNPTNEIATAVEKRRSDRISLGVHLEAIGVDVFGKSFHEPAMTERVSRHGASLIVARALAPEQVITLQRHSPRLEAEARVIGQVGICATGHVYGIALLHSVDFWGIRFAPLPPAEDALVRLVLTCCGCSLQEVVDVSEVEISVLQANDRLVRPCIHCGKSTSWSHGKNSQSGLLSAQDNPGGNLLASALTIGSERLGNYPTQRRHARVRANLLSCIQQPGSEELVRTIDISRGGLRFQSNQEYKRNAWVQAAVPYTVDGANIFVPARIVWGAVFSGDPAVHYGVKYVVSSY